MYEDILDANMQQIMELIILFIAFIVVWSIVTNWRGERLMMCVSLVPCVKSAAAVVLLDFFS